MVSPAVDALIAKASERCAAVFEAVMDLWEQLQMRPVADETTQAESGLVQRG